MNAKEFEKSLISGLNSLSKQDIEKIREEYNLEGDYGITPEGQSYWIAPERTASFKIEYKINYRMNEFDRIQKLDIVSDKVPQKIQHFDFDSLKTDKEYIYSQIKTNLNIDPKAA